MAGKDLLIEIGTEELPPRSLALLSASLATELESALALLGLKHGPVSRYATPRRLAVFIRRLAEQQPDPPWSRHHANDPERTFRSMGIMTIRGSRADKERGT